MLKPTILRTKPRDERLRDLMRHARRRAEKAARLEERAQA